MGFNGWKPSVPSESSKQFSENQHVSFMYRKEIRSGKIKDLLTNSAIIELESIKGHKEKNETIVIGYDKLYGSKHE